MHRHPPSSRQGFTLIELSAVLAIIGLLVGGVMAGNYMLRQATLQSIVTDLTKFQSAYDAFKKQYGGMPGDILDATDYWGVDPNGCPTNAIYTPRKETCNSNGDNQISWGSYESFRAWQQLSDAGLIEGSFSGVTGSGSAWTGVPGQNIPAGKISNTGYYISTLGPYSGDASAAYYNMPLSETILFGVRTGSSWTSTPALSAREQSGIDSKMDDGQPSTGTVRSFKNSPNPGCTTSDVSGSATYSLPTKGNTCSLFYLIDGL